MGKPIYVKPISINDWSRWERMQFEEHTDFLIVDMITVLQDTAEGEMPHLPMKVEVGMLWVAVSRTLGEEPSFEEVAKGPWEFKAVEPAQKPQSKAAKKKTAAAKKAAAKKAALEPGDEPGDEPGEVPVDPKGPDASSTID